jgi:tRNA-2-methylthio-N6-dimethylallyladenosine synthase
MPGQVDEQVKDERLQRLQALLTEQQMAFNASQVGQTLPVLFERNGRHGGQIVGRSPYLQGVHAHGPDRLIGQIVAVRITGSSLNSLTGELETVKVEELA